MKINKILVIVLILMVGVVSASDEGLIAHWSFDSISGNTVYDGAGNNDGTIHGAKVADGISGKALEGAFSLKFITVTLFSEAR